MKGNDGPKLYQCYVVSSNANLLVFYQNRELWFKTLFNPLLYSLAVLKCRA